MIDLTDFVAEILGVIGLGLLAWIGAFVKQRFGFELEEADRQKLDDALSRGIALAVAEIGGEDGKITVHVKNRRAKRVLKYVQETSPDLTQRVTGGIVQRLEARINAQLAQMEGPQP